MLCFGKVDLKILKHLQKELTSIFKDFFYEIQIIDEICEFPEESYDAERSQYSAPLVLLAIREYAKENKYDKILGITGLDIFAPDGIYLFAESEFGSHAKAAIISLHHFYLDFYKKPPNVKLFLLRLVKESIHEIGHILGLDHCMNECVMLFSKVVSDVDTKPAIFCDECQKKLELMIKF